MNQRDALKFAASELLGVAKREAASYAAGEAVIPDEWSGSDIDRVVKGFQTLATRLQYTVTGERALRPEAEDPDQYPLFDKE